MSVAYPALQSRRAALRAAGLCINGPRTAGTPGVRGVVHGPVISGGKCQRCVDVHTRAQTAYVPIDTVLAMPSVQVVRELQHFESLAVREFTIAIPRRRISWMLRYLLQEGRVERVSAGRNPLWRITDAGRSWLASMLRKSDIEQYRRTA